MSSKHLAHAHFTLGHVHRCSERQSDGVGTEATPRHEVNVDEPLVRPDGILASGRETNCRRLRTWASLGGGGGGGTPPRPIG